MNWVTLPGVPLGTKVFSKLQTPMRLHPFNGLHCSGQRSEWSLASFSQEVYEVTRGAIVLGQDYGGLVGANVSLQVPIRALVLTGSALGPWWLPTKYSSIPVLQKFFYHCFGGSLFAKRGFLKENRSTVEQDFQEELAIPDLPTRMRNTARALEIPKGLAQKLSVPVFLVWGKKDRWYPPIVAQAISKAISAPIFWVDGGHYCMWESPQQFDSALRQIEERLL